MKCCLSTDKRVANHECVPSHRSLYAQICSIVRIRVTNKSKKRVSMVNKFNISCTLKVPEYTFHNLPVLNNIKLEEKEKYKVGEIIPKFTTT